MNKMWRYKAKHRRRERKLQERARCVARMRSLELRGHQVIAAAALYDILSRFKTAIHA